MRLPDDIKTTSLRPRLRSSTEPARPSRSFTTVFDAWYPSLKSNILLATTIVTITAATAHSFTLSDLAAATMRMITRGPVSRHASSLKSPSPPSSSRALRPKICSLRSTSTHESPTSVAAGLWVTSLSSLTKYVPLPLAMRRSGVIGVRSTTARPRRDRRHRRLAG